VTGAVTRLLESVSLCLRGCKWVGASVMVLEQHYAHVLPFQDADLSFADRGLAGTDVGRIWDEVTGPPSGSTEVGATSPENGDPGAIRPSLTLPMPILLPVTVRAHVAA
jgi:hypothetical protein